MRFLHTSDWHIGKSLKGRSRLDDQEAVLREIVGVARVHEVDAVLVAGDVYDSAAPSAEAQRLAVQTLLGFRGTGAEVIVIAGNHDHPRSFEAYRPLMGAAGITMVGTVRRADKGGVVAFNARGSGEPVRVALLPFVSQRYAVRAAELVTQTPAQSAARYDQMVRDLLAALSQGFADDAVNLVLAHLTVTGGRFGGVSGSPSRSSTTTCRRRPSPPTRTTWRSATCTAARRCRRPARWSTAARRSPSTSARRTTPRWCGSSTRRRACRPAGSTSR